jgi:hypothetical protein
LANFSASPVLVFRFSLGILVTLSSMSPLECRQDSLQKRPSDAVVAGPMTALPTRSRPARSHCEHRIRLSNLESRQNTQYTFAREKIQKSYCKKSQGPVTSMLPFLASPRMEVGTNIVLNVLEGFSAVKM